MPDYAKGDEPLGEDESGFEIPVWFKVLSASVSFALIAFPTIFLIRYSVRPEHFVSPVELGLVPLILCGAATLLFVLAPWKALGLRVRKVGFLEFERVVNAQATEHAQEFTELRTRIDELETRVRGLDDIASISENFEDLELRPLILRFLIDYGPNPFSPLRIRDWGGKQPGFEKLGQTRISTVRRILKALVSSGQASTRISRMGNTLYKVAD